MSRTVFAGATYTADRPRTATSTPPGSDGHAGRVLNRHRPRGLAARPDRARADGAPTQRRGMPNLNLTEAQIDSLVAYLSDPLE